MFLDETLIVDKYNLTLWSDRLYTYAKNVVPGPEEDRFYLPISNAMLAAAATNMALGGITGRGLAMVFGLVNFI
jgi:hypothetical protein